MKVEKINLFTPQKTARQTKVENNQNYIQNNTYNPIAYKDYNVNFTARLFRTPENFYAQPFNMNGMPDLMRNYLLDDFEDRRKMPPAQMLSVTYDDINETSNLEQVKKIFSKENRFEPLFQNLTDVPNRKARTGVIAEIELMKEEGKTLFKNGKDNLGHYILKKIYLEGKSLKEINKDFKRDISVHYNGLSPIGYDTLSAYGIKYPNNGFWKSLLATREEFPYEYKPRKANARSLSYHKTDVKNPVETVKYRPKNKFDGMKDWEIDKITDAVVKGNGNNSETVKNLKRTGVRDESSLNFVAKYMGEINSIVLEKLHISPDMKDFFENYDGLSKNQKQKFTEYMRLPEINEWRSKVMQSTIRTFFDSYGVDGNNEEFKQLLDYAHNIKPNRIKLAEEHAKRQAFYDEIFAQKPETHINTDNSLNDLKELNNKLEEAKKLLEELKDCTYEFNTSKGKVQIIGDIENAFAECIRDTYSCFPDNYVNKFIRFIKKQPQVDDKYFLTSLLLSKDIELPEDERLLSSEQHKEISSELTRAFSEKYIKETESARQAAIDTILSVMPKKKDYLELYTFSSEEFSKLWHQVPEELSELLNKTKVFMNNRYEEYLKPLSESECNKLSLQLINQIKDYEFANNSNYKNEKETMHLIYSTFLPVKNNSSSVQVLRNHFRKSIKDYGASAKMLLDKSISKAEKLAKLEQIMFYELNHQSSFILQYNSVNPECLKYLKENLPQLHEIIQKEVIPFVFKSL